MMMIGDTLFCWPQKGDRQFLTPIVASLGFALSPLIIIWSRTAVSDALLTGTLGISLLLFWRRMASKNNDQCISAWVFLGFAILTKGPVAFVLASLTIISFLFCQKNWERLLCKINPKKGILITILISIPWYILELIKEGSPSGTVFLAITIFKGIHQSSIIMQNRSGFFYILCCLLHYHLLLFMPRHI